MQTRLAFAVVLAATIATAQERCNVASRMCVDSLSNIVTSGTTDKQACRESIAVCDEAMKIAKTAKCVGQSVEGIQYSRGRIKSLCGM